MGWICCLLLHVAKLPSRLRPVLVLHSFKKKRNHATRSLTLQRSQERPVGRTGGEERGPDIRRKHDALPQDFWTAATRCKAHEAYAEVTCNATAVGPSDSPIQVAILVREECIRVALRPRIQVAILVREDCLCVRAPPSRQEKVWAQKSSITAIDREKNIQILAAGSPQQQQQNPQPEHALENSQKRGSEWHAHAQLASCAQQKRSRNACVTARRLTRPPRMQRRTRGGGSSPARPVKNKSQEPRLGLHSAHS